MLWCHLKNATCAETCSGVATQPPKVSSRLAGGSLSVFCRQTQVLRCCNASAAGSGCPVSSSLSGTSVTCRARLHEPAYQTYAGKGQPHVASVYVSGRSRLDIYSPVASPIPPIMCHPPLSSPIHLLCVTHLCPHPSTYYVSPTSVLTYPPYVSPPLERPAVCV
jgi:hypothetical protein